MVKDPYNLIITGVGGQGNVLASQMIGRILLKNGYKITVGETYGLSQRGGAVLSHIRISKSTELGPLIPKGLAHAVMALEPVEALRVLPDYGNKDVITVVNSRPVHPMGVIAGETTYPDLDILKEKLWELSGALYWVDATRIAMDLGDAILANMVMLGALIQTGLLDMTVEDVMEEIEGNFPESKREINRKALKQGMEAIG